MSKKQNEITWQRFKAAMEGSKDMATNRGFRMRDGQMVTYEQQKLGLSAYYDKFFSILLISSSSSILFLLLFFFLFLLVFFFLLRPYQ